MRVVLEITSDPGTGQKVEVRPGQVLKVGRSNQADYAIPHDTFLSGRHFSLELEEGKCLLRDLRSSNGTTVGGKRVSEAELDDGDQVAAGRTTFKVHIEGLPEAKGASDPAEAGAAPGRNGSSSEEGAIMLPKPPFEDPEQARKEALEKEAAERAEIGEHEKRPPLTEPQKKLLEILRNQPEPLYAVLDAARDEAILDLLFQSREEYESLFEGEPGHELRDFSPHIVRLAPNSTLLADLVRNGWGHSWGVFLTCRSSFEEVRNHLRKFLIVQTEEGRQLYFRFYDPRVLRGFLPTCTHDETYKLFGPIRHFLVEGEECETILRFEVSQQGVSTNIRSYKVDCVDASYRPRPGEANRAGNVLRNRRLDASENKVEV